MPSVETLRQLQSLPLEAKVVLTQQRIREWYEHFNGDVFVSFSGGKDSTVLAHLVHEIYPDVPLVFANTGLEYPEIQAFARKMGAVFVRPKKTFKDVIINHGYPLISKEVSGCIFKARKVGETENRKSEYTYSVMDMACNYTSSNAFSRFKLTSKRKDKDNELIRDSVYTGDYESTFNQERWGLLAHEAPFLIGDECCKIIKKSPMYQYQKDTGFMPYVGTQTEESKLRENSWVKSGCNAFDNNHAQSRPLSFWTEQDILKYIKDNSIELASVYGEVCYNDGEMFYSDMLCDIGGELKCSKCQRTGCIYCAYGFHLERTGITRFQRLAVTHPKQYDYCMGGGTWVDNPNYSPTAPEYDGYWKNWNPKKIWQPNEKGLGLEFVFEYVNDLYGKEFYRYD